MLNKIRSEEDRYTIKLLSVISQTFLSTAQHVHKQFKNLIIWVEFLVKYIKVYMHAIKSKMWL